MRKHKSYVGIGLLICVWICLTYGQSYGEQKSPLHKQLVQEIKQEVLENYPYVLPKNVTVSLTNIEKLEKQLSKDHVVRLVPSKHSMRLGQSMYRVSIQNKNTNKKTKQSRKIPDYFQLMAQVEAVHPFYQSAKKIEGGETIRSSDILPIISKVSTQSKTVIKNKKEIVGNSAAFTIQKGTILTSWLLKEPIQFQKGEKVNVILSHSEVQLNMKAQLLETGYLDKAVRVRILPTKKIMYGVVKNNYVEIKNKH